MFMLDVERREGKLMLGECVNFYFREKYLFEAKLGYLTRIASVLLLRTRPSIFSVAAKTAALEVQQS